MFEIAAPEIGEVVRKTQNNCKRCGNKNSSETFGRWKKEIQRSLKLQLFKGILFDAFKKEKAEHKAKSEDDSDEEPHTYLTYVNNLLHSVFSNCENYFNNTMV